MEIRFCDRCTESIPDADFESGRAVTVDGHHYHVNCALTRSLALNGPRSWLTFVLALYAAGVVTFLLVGALGKGEKAPSVPPIVEARIQEAVADAARTARQDRTRAIADAKQEDARARAAALEKLADDLDAKLEVISTRIGETDLLSKERITTLSNRVDRWENEIARLAELIRKVQEDAAAEAARRVATPPTPPPTEPPPKTEPEQPPATPPRVAPPSDPERDAEVARWIERLKDSNENVRFGATLELGRLKDLRAAEPLVTVLSEDKDYYVRLGAATALGDIKACAAVPALIEALDDKDGLVRTAANDSLQAITGQAFEFVTEMSGRERRKVMKQWRDWWKENEPGVRDRLGQDVP